MSENEEKSKILKESLVLIEKLAAQSTVDLDSDAVIKLIRKARNIKNNKYFKL